MSPKQITHVERMKRRILQLEGVSREMDAELQRHKRAIEWLRTSGVFHASNDGTFVYSGAKDLDIPPDIADLIKGEK